MSLFINKYQTVRKYPAFLVFTVILTLGFSVLRLESSVPEPGRRIDSPDTLKNQNLKALFTEKGLSSIYDRKQDRTYEFTKDGFSVTIDDKTVERASFPNADVREENSKIVYTVDENKYKIEVIYELRADWKFVSKQLVVSSKSNTKFTVNEVKVVDQALAERPEDDYEISSRFSNVGAREYGAFLRFGDKSGMLALVQNPFLNYERDNSSYTITYQPEMEWKTEYGPFLSDRACIATYKLTGNRLRTYLVPEWEWVNGDLSQGEKMQDWAEIEAFTNMVEHFISDEVEKPIDIHVGWTGNDYQIDVSVKSGREEYKRIIKRSAELGVEHIVYAPYNSELGNHLNTTDAWHWENLLWLGLGKKVRKGEWNPKSDPIPSSIDTMLKFAESRGVHLMAYVYPVLPFEGNPDWIVENTRYHGDENRVASLGNRSLQNWLIENLSSFKKRTGISGFAFDYTFFWYEGTSTYAQWWGWRRVKETLRKRFPDIIMDGRQLNHAYGPWGWLAGSYPHPTAADEQPESFNPFPDIHADRVAANRQRFTAYRYRIQEYAPPKIMPGFITHQTSRNDYRGRLVREPFRIRDWDYLGWKFSLISSIATAGLNNVVSMIPARDPEEYRNFSKEDIAFMKAWLDWTKEKKEYLLEARPILGQPAMGKVDGMSALKEDEGYVFLFNPNGRSMNASFDLNQSIGLDAGKEFVIKELYPVEGKRIAKPNEGVWKYGDNVQFKMDGARARVLEIQPLSSESREDPVLYNVTGNVDRNGTELILSDITGEVGTKTKIVVELFSDKRINFVSVNGTEVAYKQDGSVVTVFVEFAGKPFQHMEQVGGYNSDFTGGTFEADFTIPKRIFAQLEERRKQWPIPWTEPNYQTPWLVPERLPLFVQIAEPADTMDVTMKIDNEPVELKKAYSAIRDHSPSFVGFYADLSNLEPDRTYHVELDLPELEAGQFQGLFFENVVTEYTGEIAH